MKILVINGSPKKELSDTMVMTNAFLEGMKENADIEVKIIHSIDKKIQYCTGCYSCTLNGGTCVIEDEMKDILQEMLDSDLLLFSYPLYYYGMPASLKALVDRTLPLASLAMKEENGRYVHLVQKDISRLKFLMICGCGFPNSKQNFEPAILQFKQIFPHDHTIITVPESPLFHARGAEFVTEPRLNLIREAGKQYSSSGHIDEKLMEQITSPMIPEEEYARIANSQVGK